MITPDYARQMARYNAWQNRSLYREAAALTEDEREADRGAFWGSIRATLCHLLWGDSLWMSRFAGWDPPPRTGGKGGTGWLRWDEMRELRPGLDGRIIDWAQALTAADLAGDLTWYSGLSESENTRPRAMLVVHFFNHQTHHRGQVHAMLTAAGCRPDDTDLLLEPPEAKI